MGKSDDYVFPWYVKTLSDYSLLYSKKVAFLGQSGHNRFSNYFNADKKDFFDLTLGNWNINDVAWQIDKDYYDLVICTRCAYFSHDPEAFIKNALQLCKSNGYLFVDWGLGDHWRKKLYKVGWIKGGEHEDVSYGTHVSKLYSCFWIDKLETDDQVKAFKQYILNLGYYNTVSKSLSQIIHEEVPKVLDDSKFVPIDIRTYALWPESPQLYISTLYKK